MIPVTGPQGVIDTLAQTALQVARIPVRWHCRGWICAARVTRDAVPAAGGLVLRQFFPEMALLAAGQRPVWARDQKLGSPSLHQSTHEGRRPFFYGGSRRRVGGAGCQRAMAAACRAFTDGGWLRHGLVDQDLRRDSGVIGPATRRGAGAVARPSTRPFTRPSTRAFTRAGAGPARDLTGGAFSLAVVRASRYRWL
jgi:hypothetical protein